MLNCKPVATLVGVIEKLQLNDGAQKVDGTLYRSSLAP